jgi:hypothetical protein
VTVGAVSSILALGRAKVKFRPFGRRVPGKRRAGFLAENAVSSKCFTTIVVF